MPDEALQFQLAIVGESNVGKTSLTHRFVERSECQNAKPTVGIEVKQHGLERDEREIKVSYFDTAGDQKIRAMSHVYLSNSEGVMIVYDITDHESFNTLDKWLLEVRREMSHSYHTRHLHKARDGAVIMIVGNKRDERHKRQVDSQDVVHWVKENKLEGVIREEAVLMNAELTVVLPKVSAKSGEGVEEAFTTLIDATYEKFYRRQVLLDKIGSEIPPDDDEDVAVPESKITTKVFSDQGVHW